MSAAVPDARDRRRAASDFDVNFVVRAGAGTGKTELLVERVLNAIGSGRLEIECLAAITFTEKAASEMRARLASGLERLRVRAARGETAPADDAAGRAFEHLSAELRIPRAEILKRSVAALVALDRAAITTIHAFCADLLRSFPREAGVDPAFRVDQGEDFRRLVEEEWARFLSFQLGPEASHPEAWRRLLEDAGAPLLGSIARSLASFSFPRALLEAPYAAQDAREWLDGEAAQALERIAHAETASGLTNTNAAFLAIVREGITTFRAAGVEPLRAYFEADPARAYRLKQGASELGKSVVGIGKLEFNRLVSDCKRIVAGLLAIDESASARILDALRPFALSFRERYLARGLVDFDGLLHLTRDLLAKNPDVRRAARQRHRMIVVDEFQDTDPAQYDIVLFLAEVDDGSAADAFEARLQAGRLFVVGDAKQSIYRFRGADYDAFRRAAERVVQQGGVALSLTTNFRSVPGVLHAVNGLLGSSACAWTESAYQPPYEPVHAHRADAGSAVEVWTARGARGAVVTTAPLRREAEGQVLAERIHTWVSAEACRYGDITVLLRSFTSLASYLKPLRAAGIPFVVDGGREFLERPEVGHLLAVLRALRSPSDPVALLAYLRSPAGGVPDTELAAHVAAGGIWDWRQAADAARVPTLAAALLRLRALEAATRDTPADVLIRRAIEVTDLLPLSAASFEGAQRVANLRKLTRLAAELARDGKRSLHEILAVLEDARTLRIEAESPLADDAADAVRILTIHKAKGLENRRVIVADLARSNHHGSEPEPVRATRRANLAVPALAAGRIRNAACVWLDEQERRHEAAEEIRVLYVALTRACDVLALFLGRSHGRSVWTDLFGAWDYDPDAPPPDGALLDEGRAVHRLLDPRAIEPSADRAAPDASAAVAAYRSATAALARSALVTRATPSATEATAWTRGPIGDRARSRAAGTVVHAILRRAGGTSSAELLAMVGPRAANAALAAGAEPETVARDATEILESFLRSDLAARLRAATVLGREVPILLADGGSIWSGSADLLLQEGETIIVADYKTDREDDPELLAERYRAQLTVYARAVQKALGLAQLPRAELWHLRSARSIAVAPEKDFA